RKSLAAQRDAITTLLERVTAARLSFEEAADRDVVAFEHLVATQRAIKQQPAADEEETRQRLNSAYVQAAEVPLTLAREALAFMRDAEQGLAFASRFTV